MVSLNGEQEEVGIAIDGKEEYGKEDRRSGGGG